MRNILLFLLLLSMFFSCSKAKYPGYKETDNGLYYKIIDKKNNDKKVSEGDFLNIKVKYKTFKDSIFFDSEMEVIPVWIPIVKTSYKGDIMEGLSMLSLGDSASFIVNADNFFRLTIGTQNVPNFFKDDSMMYVDLRVMEIKTHDEFVLEQEILRKETENQLNELKEKEKIDLKNYLEINNITQKPTKSGLIFIQSKRGNGKFLQIGQNVKVHYQGYFIDGQIFDSSIDKMPLEVTVGSPDLIEGFNEALLLMSPGAKAKAIMPSKIAFGMSDFNSPIPPFATVIFDISVLENN